MITSQVLSLETFRNFWRVLLVPSSKKQLFQQDLKPSVFSEEGYVRKKVKENLHRHNEKIYITLKSDKIKWWRKISVAFTYRKEIRLTQESTH